MEGFAWAKVQGVDERYAELTISAMSDCLKKLTVKVYENAVATAPPTKPSLILSGPHT
jgi:hypothetical protein